MDLQSWLILFGIALALLLIGGYSYYQGFHEIKKRYLMENTPTSSIRSMAMGLVELKGKARTNRPIHTPITGIPCVYYTVHAKQFQYVDRYFKWVTLYQDHWYVPFFLEQDGTAAYIDPSGAEVRPRHVRSFLHHRRNRRTFNEFDNVLYRLKAISEPKNVLSDEKYGLKRIRYSRLYILRTRLGNRIYEERYIPVDSDIYVLGNARPSAHQRISGIVSSTSTQKLLVSAFSEEELRRGQKIRSLKKFLLGGLALAAGIGLLILLIAEGVQDI